MGRHFVVAGGLAVAMAAGVRADERHEPGEDLRALAVTLNLTDKGVARWLEKLGVTGEGEQTERLLAVSMTGEVLMQRQGGRGFVRVDSELDDLLLRPDMAIVLIHNHPANVGLSLDDMRHLTKPGVVAMVAIGHDGSVYLASAGPRISRPWFDDGEYTAALAAVRSQLRIEWPAGRLSIAAGDAHTSHLVALTLARAGIIRYWFKFRGSNLVTYEDARFIFNRIVVVAAGGMTKR
jgi:hypothetical protein